MADAGLIHVVVRREAPNNQRIATRRPDIYEDESCLLYRFAKKSRFHPTFFRPSPCSVLLNTNPTSEVSLNRFTQIENP